MLNRRSMVFGLAAAVGSVASGAVAAPRAALIDRHWLQHGSVADPDYQAWSRILEAARIDATGLVRVAYGDVSPMDIDGVVRALERIAPTSLNRDAAFAYWCNLYNAVMVREVVRAYPIRSVRALGGLFSNGPWREKLVTVEGRALSLDNIEHGILRPVFRDARIHYAVNCASVGCPNLRMIPWTGAGLARSLDDAARTFVRHARGVSIEGGTVRASSIYSWFEDDFGGGGVAGVISHLRRYAVPSVEQALTAAGRIDQYRYDWTLNDIR